MKKHNCVSGMIILACFIALYLSSCSVIDPKYTKDDTPPEIPKKSQPTFEENLDKLIGELTYDQALMTWGQPASVFYGDEIFIVAWGNSKSGSAIFPIYTTWFALPIESGQKLQLSFNKISRKLINWKYDKW